MMRMMRAVRVLALVPFILIGASEAWGAPRKRFPLKSSKATRPQGTTAFSHRLASKNAPQRTEKAPRLSLGVVTTGAQVRGRFGNRLGVEARYLWNKQSSDTGDVDAKVIGGRLYLFSRPNRGFTVFGGAEGAALSSKVGRADPSYKGLFTGGFAGVEYRLSERFSWGMDAGYYQLTLKNAVLSINNAGSGFVLNSYLNFHLF